MLAQDFIPPELLKYVGPGAAGAILLIGSFIPFWIKVINPYIKERHTRRMERLREEREHEEKRLRDEWEREEKRLKAEREIAAFRADETRNVQRGAENNAKGAEVNANMAGTLTNLLSLTVDLNKEMRIAVHGARNMAMENTELKEQAKERKP